MHKNKSKIEQNKLIFTWERHGDGDTNGKNENQFHFKLFLSEKKSKSKQEETNLIQLFFSNLN